MTKYLSQDKLKAIINAYITSQLSYSPLTWMCDIRYISNCINMFHERALRIVYGDYNSSFNDLLKIDGSCSIHHRNIQSLESELFKCKIERRLLFWISYSNRILNNLSFPLQNSPLRYTRVCSILAVRYGKSCPMNLRHTKVHNVSKDTEMDLKKCLCRLCKDYVYRQGFINIVY